MRHTDDEIEQAGLRFELLAEGLDPATVKVELTEDLRQIAASSRVRGAATRREAVAATRTRAAPVAPAATAAG